MSILSGKTDKQAIKELAKCLIHFERLSLCNMSAQDAIEARQAQNLIRAVIQSNGFGVIYKAGKGTRIYKRRKNS